MNIKQIREKTSLSQAQFSKRYNIPLRSLQKWEQGSSEPLPYLISLLENDINFKEFISVEKYQLKKENKFKVILEKPMLNADKIHPFMQKDVFLIVDELSKYEEVKRIIIFGSSTTYKCNIDSDIDVYVELSKDINVKSFNIETPIDYWTNFTVDKIMLKEILKKGVVVYDCK